jgi:predicted secreted acid phosphatase
VARAHARPRGRSQRRLSDTASPRPASGAGTCPGEALTTFLRIRGGAIKKSTPHGWRAKLRHARAARHGHGPKNLAIVFDVDETLLSNITAIEADNFTFGPASQAEATNEIGKAIAPSLTLYNDAKARGLTIFLITGRRENTRAHTTSNLTREGFTGFKQLVLKPDASTDSTVVYKSGARAAIEQQGYKIVANVGDQYSDLAGGHSASAFKLANPFYFLP